MSNGPTSPERSTKPASRIARLLPKLSRRQFIVLVVGLLAVAGLVYLYGGRMARGNPNSSTELIVVQLNDIYRLDSVRNGKQGGLARVATVLRQLKTENPQVPIIVLHAGDFLSPSLETEVFHGAQMVDALNFLNTIASVYVVPGNHEFDFGADQTSYVTDAINRSKFQWVASNLERSDAALLAALRNNVAERVLQSFGNVKVGIFALTIDGSHRGKDKPYAPIAGDYLAIAKYEIERLERCGADIIFGLTHLDIGDDREIAKLRRDYPRFRWIAGGHEHERQYDQASSDKALVTKGDSNARSIWKVSVVMRDGNAEVVEQDIRVDETIQADADFDREITKRYHDEMRRARPYLDAEITKQQGRCYDGTEETVRNKESDWGSLLAGYMRRAYRNVQADVAVINGGSLRIDDTFCNQIRFEHLERTFAFASRVVFVKLTGKDLKEQILDSSLKSKRGDGRFLQVSGVRFGTSDVDQKKQYIVAVPEYLFNCGDGYQFRRYVSEYIPPGPDLRSLTYRALAAKSQASPNNVPEYAKQTALGVGQWKTLSVAERQCQ